MADIKVQAFEIKWQGVIFLGKKETFKGMWSDPEVWKKYNRREEASFQKK